MKRFGKYKEKLERFEKERDMCKEVKERKIGKKVDEETAYLWALDFRGRLSIENDMCVCVYIYKS